MMIRPLITLCALSLIAAAGTAQDAAPPASTVALTPEQREAALEYGAARVRDESLQYGAGDRKVHGEVGVEVGSRGERAAYGTVVAPIGNNAVAAFSYGTGQGPRWRGRRGRFSGSSVSAGFSNDTDLAPANAENVNPD